MPAGKINLPVLKKFTGPPLPKLQNIQLKTPVSLDVSVVIDERIRAMKAEKIMLKQYFEVAANDSIKNSYQFLVQLDAKCEAIKKEAASLEKDAAPYYDMAKLLKKMPNDEKTLKKFSDVEEKLKAFKKEQASLDNRKKTIDDKINDLGNNLAKYIQKSMDDEKDKIYQSWLRKLKSYQDAYKTYRTDFKIETSDKIVVTLTKNFANILVAGTGMVLTIGGVVATGFTAGLAAPLALPVTMAGLGLLGSSIGLSVKVVKDWIAFAEFLQKQNESAKTAAVKVQSEYLSAKNKLEKIKEDQAKDDLKKMDPRKKAAAGRKVKAVLSDSNQKKMTKALSPLEKAIVDHGKATARIEGTMKACNKVYLKSKKQKADLKVAVDDLTSKLAKETAALGSKADKKALAKVEKLRANLVKQKKLLDFIIARHESIKEDLKKANIEIQKQLTLSVAGQKFVQKVKKDAETLNDDTEYMGLVSVAIKARPVLEVGLDAGQKIIGGLQGVGSFVGSAMPLASG